MYIIWKAVRSDFREFCGGIDYLRDLIEVAIKYDIIQKAGAWFDIVDVETGELLEGKIHGQANVYEKLQTNEELLDRVETLVDNIMFKEE